MSELINDPYYEKYCLECGHDVSIHIIDNGKLHGKCDYIRADGKACNCSGIFINNS